MIGLGTVGEWVLRALHAGAGPLAARYGVRFSVVGVASSSRGFGYDPAGLDLSALLGSGSGRMPGSRLPTAGPAGAGRWPSAIEGLRATDADVLVEVTGSPAADGEPGLSHLREALGRGIPVVTSNKWPVALHGVELAGLARRHGVPLRAEATVMSGTPVLSTLVEGLAGATPTGVRGIMNATANAILTGMAAGQSYESALAAARQAGLAERDPAADVEGHDAAVGEITIIGPGAGPELAGQGVLSDLISVARQGRRN